MAIHNALRTPGCTGIKSTTGAGKSSIMAKELAQLPGIEDAYVEIYGRTNKEQDRWREDLAKIDPTLQVLPIYGRNEENCAKYELAEFLGTRMIPVTPNLCYSGSRKKGTRTECEFYSNCKYFAQFNKDPGVRIYSHAYLNMERNPKDLPKPSIIIIDENPIPVAVNVSEAKVIAALRGDALRLNPAHGPEQGRLGKIIEAIKSGRPILEELRTDDPRRPALTPEDLYTLAETLVVAGRRGFAGRPGQADKDIMACARRADHSAHYLAVNTVKALAAELETDRRQSHAVWRVGEEAKLRVRSGLQRLREVETVLLLDADLEPENLRPIFPDLHVETIEAVQNAWLVQIDDSSMAKKKFGLREKTPDFDRIKNLISVIRKLPGQRKLVVTYKALRPYLEARIPGAMFTHFGGLRGSNDYKDCDTAIIIGRNFPPPEAIKDMAAALHFDSAEDLNFSDPIPMRHAVGGNILTSYDFIDDRVQAVMRSVREAETRQAIGRLRLVHAVERKEVFIISSQPVGLPIDEFRTFEPSKAEKIIRELGGFLPLHGADLARLASKWFKGVKAACDWRDTNKPSFVYSTIIQNSVNYLETTYRRGNKAGRPSRLVVDPTLHSFPEMSLPAKLAAPGENPADIKVTPLPWVASDSHPKGLPLSFHVEELSLPSGEKLRRMWPCPPRTVIWAIPAVWQLKACIGRPTNRIVEEGGVDTDDAPNETQDDAPTADQ